MTALVEYFLQAECSWASEAEKNIIRAYVDDCVRFEESTAEYAILCFRNTLNDCYAPGTESVFIRVLARYLEWRASHSELDEELYKAIEQQDLDMARALIGQNVSMNHGYSNDGILTLSIANCYTQRSLWIIENAQALKVDLNQQDQFIWSHDDKEEHIPGFRTWVARRIDVEDRLGWQQGPHLRNTPLIIACKKGWDHIDTQYDAAEEGRPPPRMGNVIAALLEAGADPNVQDACGNTALHIAMLHREERAVRLLLKHGAKLDIRNNAGLLPEDMLKVHYRDIRSFLYQQTGNDVNDYIHTMKDYNAWRKAGRAVLGLLRSHNQPSESAPALGL